jgi:hypothetical protein
MSLIRAHLCIPSHWTAKQIIDFVNRNQGLTRAIQYGHVPQKSELYELNKAFEMLEEDRKKKNKSMTAAEKRSRKDLKRRLDKLLDDEKMHLKARKDDRYAENEWELSWAIKRVRQVVEKSLTMSGLAPNMNPPLFRSSSSVPSPSSRPNSDPAKDLASASHITSDRDAGSTSANSSEETSAQSSNSATELNTFPMPHIVPSPEPFPSFDPNTVDPVGQASSVEQGIYREVELGGKEIWDEAAERLVQETTKRSRSEKALMEDPKLGLYRVREPSHLRRSWSWSRKWDGDVSEERSC